MYLLEDQLKNRMQQIAAVAATQSWNAVRFEEYIALPCFGQIILRFTLDQIELSLSDLDHYETMLYEIVGNEFLIDFMGSVYQKVGVSYADLEDRLIKLSKQLADELLPSSIHGKGLKEDAAFLLQAAGLRPDERVWEIQPNDDALVLLIMGKQNRKLKEVDAGVKLYVGEVPEQACLGLMKAACYAKRTGVSLARILLLQ